MPTTILLALAGALPQVPMSSVQVAQEGTVYVMRNLIDNNPLYTFGQDERGKSNCNDACATAWRPLRVSGGEEPIGRWAQIERSDGSIQWAYDGMPVYSFAQDPEPVILDNGRVGGWRLLPSIPAQ